MKIKQNQNVVENQQQKNLFYSVLSRSLYTFSKSKFKLTWLASRLKLKSLSPIQTGIVNELYCTRKSDPKFCLIFHNSHNLCSSHPLKSLRQIEIFSIRLLFNVMFTNMLLNYKNHRIKNHTFKLKLEYKICNLLQKFYVKNDNKH